MFLKLLYEIGKCDLQESSPLVALISLLLSERAFLYIHHGVRSSWRGKWSKRGETANNRLGYLVRRPLCTNL